MRQVVGMAGRATCVLSLAALALSACTARPSSRALPSPGTSAAEPAGAKSPRSSDVPPELVDALARSRASGSARTVTFLPPGVLPTTRFSGVVDFVAERSETLIEIHRNDGVALPYARVVRSAEGKFFRQHHGQDEPVWQRSGEASGDEFASPIFDGLLALGELERQAPRMRPDPDATGRYRILGRPATDGPTRPGLLVMSARVDSDGRIAEVTVILPTMTDAGEFRMVFTAYGEPVRITVPTV